MNESIKHDITELAEKIINGSVYFQMKGVTNGSAVQVVADKVAEFVMANYECKPKITPWFGIDLDQRIKELKQELAITYAKRNRMKEQQPI